MALRPQQIMRTFWPAAARGMTGLTAALMLTACAETADLLPKANTLVADADDQGSSTQSELQKATSYWGKEYAKSPSQLKPALNYAKNLKALGEKQQALAVLQRASSLHGTDAELASEYGRLALELDQLSIAEKVLEFADSATKPDWRVVSARGTVLSKKEQFKDAIPFFERALQLQPNQPSVLSNLAMAHAMSGDAKKAEELLRQAAATPGASPKIRQNLALVLGLQGRYDESKTYAATDLATDAAQANTDYIRQMVKLQAKPAQSATPASFTTEVKPAPATVAAATAKVSRPKDPQLKPAAVDVTPVATSDAGWRTNVASSATVAAPAAGSDKALKGSSQ